MVYNVKQQTEIQMDEMKEENHWNHQRRSQINKNQQIINHPINFENMFEYECAVDMSLEVIFHLDQHSFRIHFGDRPKNVSAEYSSSI